MVKCSICIHDDPLDITKDPSLVELNTDESCNPHLRVEEFSENEKLHKYKKYLTHCWNCKGSINSDNSKRDQVNIFMFICNQCGNSLREWSGVIEMVADRFNLSIENATQWVEQLKKLPKV